MRLLRPEEFPSLIRIGNEVYHVLFADKLKNNDMGVCDDALKLIILSKDQSIDELNATFWHEVLHAFEKEGRMRLGHRVIDKLEWLILQVAKQLPQLPD